MKFKKKVIFTSNLKSIDNTNIKLNYNNRNPL